MTTREKTAEELEQERLEDEFLAKFIRKPGDPRPAYAFQTDNIAEEMEKIPLFMTKLPENIDDNPALMAIQALLYEGTPEEIALNFKDQGNEAYLAGASRYSDALEYYTKGIEQNSCDYMLNATLYLNRAAVWLHKKHFTFTKNDCAAAIVQLRKLEESGKESVGPKEPKEMEEKVKLLYKAHLRAAKASFALEEYKLCIDQFTHALQIDPNNIELQAALKLAKEKYQEHLSNQLVRAKEEKLRARINVILEKRGVTIEPGCETDLLTLLAPETDRSLLGHVSFIPQSASILQWPVFFLYPPYGQSDFIAAFDERSTIYSQVEIIFSAPAAWDTDRLYIEPKQLQVYYNVPATRTIYRIEKSCSLEKTIGTIIKQVHHGILAFYIVPRTANATFLEKFDAPLSMPTIV